MMTDLEYARLYLSLQINEAVSWWCFYIREISWQLLIALLAYLCVCVFLYAILKRVDHAAWQLPGPPSRLLLVTAHPDDEVMFFGPLVYGLARTKASEIYLLCLSMGTYPLAGFCHPKSRTTIWNNQARCRKRCLLMFTSVLAGGDRRRTDELWACTRVLGIPEANVTIIMSSELPDDQDVQWPTDTVAESILQYVEMYKINAVVTFDKYGVSRHKNHISLYFAIAALCIEKKVPPYCKLYVLESVNIIRKYIQLLDLPISLLSASYWYLVTYEQKRTIKSAMAAHKSQYVWFRKLYMIFSRYTFINTLQEVSALDLELDLQFDED